MTEPDASPVDDRASAPVPAPDGAVSRRGLLALAAAGGVGAVAGLAAGAAIVSAPDAAGGTPASTHYPFFGEHQGFACQPQFLQRVRRERNVRARDRTSDRVVPVDRILNNAVCPPGHGKGINGPGPLPISDDGLALQRTSILELQGKELRWKIC